MSRKSAARHLMLILGLCVLSLAPTCGKRRLPLPPIERIPQRTEALTGVQRGNEITLMWPAPLRNAGEGSVQSIRRVDVYRVAEKLNAPLPMTEDQFEERATLIGSVAYEEIKKGGATLTYTDRLELTSDPARLRYAIRYVNSSGQRAAFSNFFLMTPAFKVAAPPTNTNGEKRETANIITWDAPDTNMDGSTPVNLLGYNVYRILKSQPETDLKPLNAEPVTATRYEDKRFKFGEAYTYFVRAISLGTEAKPVESLNSNQIEILQTDIYKPAAPDLATPNAAPGRIALFWTANSEPDVVGYYLHRSTDPNLALDKWPKVTPQLYTRTTFTDENVETGKAYYYYVEAVDSAGNVSPPSKVVSDTVP
jgi:fibronectin type 3 domain-containing protein